LSLGEQEFDAERREAAERIPAPRKGDRQVGWMCSPSGGLVNSLRATGQHIMPGGKRGEQKEKEELTQAGG
jgi:hypothetical protein